MQTRSNNHSTREAAAAAAAAAPQQLLVAAEAVVAALNYLLSLGTDVDRQLFFFGDATVCRLYCSRLSEAAAGKKEVF